MVDISKVTRGLEVSQILSDEKHYSHFICNICHNLVSLDAVVTNKCSHPFCRRCLEEWATKCCLTGRPCSCPTCRCELMAKARNNDNDSTDEGCMEFGSIIVAARPLRDDQPLAYRVLSMVQVACVDRASSGQCDWSGDYGKYIQHIALHLAADGAQERSPSSPRLRAANASTKNGRPSLADYKSVSVPDFSPRNGASPSSSRRGSRNDSSKQDQSPGRRKRRDTPTRRSMERKARSLRNVVADLENEQVDEQPSTAEEPISFDSIKTPPSPRWQANNSIFSSPKPQKDLLPSKVSRQLSEKANPNLDTSEANKDVEVGVPPAILEERPANSKEWNTSINSLAFWSDSFNEANPMETVDEESHEGESTVQQSLQDEMTFTSPDEKARLLLERAEKLKKQANAKFNKGDFTAARTLYTEGINVMGAIVAVTEAECKLLSGMHSNRAVTFFREKDFKTCAEDCNKAIGYDPTYDKSWIRKWRALMALGSMEEALECLEGASKAIPGSKRIEDELSKFKEEMGVLNKGRELLHNKEYRKVLTFLANHISLSSNIAILCLAARAEILLGETEAALELANKALRLNPNHPEGLEIRGYSIFLDGETEKGSHIVYEAYCRDRDNKALQETLSRLQKTQSAFAQGRSAVKRGRYEEAAEQFSIAIKGSEDAHPKTALFSTIRTERAEAYLLSMKMLEALRDCQEVLSAQREYAPAWLVRSEVLISLGKAQEAHRELSRIRRTWGGDNATIEDGYRRVDFELRVLKADEDLSTFFTELTSGTCSRITPTDRSPKPGSHHNHNSTLAESNHSRISVRDGDYDLVDMRNSTQEGARDGDVEGFGRIIDRRMSDNGRSRFKRSSSTRGERRRGVGDPNTLDKQTSSRRLSETGKTRGKSSGVRPDKEKQRSEVDDNEDQNDKNERRPSGEDRGPARRKPDPDEERRAKSRKKRSDSAAVDRRRDSRSRPPQRTVSDESLSMGGERKSRKMRDRKHDDNASIGGERRSRPQTKEKNDHGDDHHNTRENQ